MKKLTLSSLIRSSISAVIAGGRPGPRPPVELQRLSTALSAV